MKKLILAILLIISGLTAFSQQATDINPNAVIVPRFADATAMNTSIPSPVQGMFIYRNDTQSFWYYTSSGWANLAAAVSGAWSPTGNNISNTNSGNVGIGVINPVYPLETKGRIRIRDSGGGESAGIWFNNNGNTALNTFIGIDPSNQFGIYSYSRFQNIFTANMATGGVRIEGPNVASPTANILSLGGYGKVGIDGPGIVGGRFSILENGNVGINNNTPSEKLEVNGNVKINNGYISFWNPTVQSHNISSSAGYLRLGGGDAISGNGVWINNTGSIFGGIKFKTEGSIAIADNEGTAGQFLTSNGAGNYVGWKSINQLIQTFELPLTPNFTVINNNQNTLPSPAILTFNCPTSGKLIIWTGWKTRYDCLNFLDHCYLSWTLKTFINGNEIDVKSIQATYAYLQFFNDHAFAPIVINVAAGNKTITFSETLNSVSLNPIVNVSALVQFIPN
jgi:hypothetical protein